MDPFLLIEWSGAYPVVSDPPTVGLAWRLEELEATTDTPETVESDREVYDNGWRWCVCYSTREPAGEKGFGRFTCSATHTGEWRGHAATHRRFETVDEVYFFSFEDGRISVAWGLPPAGLEGPMEGAAMPS